MNWLVNNLQLKILSVLLAVLLWFYVQGQDLSETTMRYFLMFSNMPENLYIDNGSSSEISVWVKAPKNILKRATTADRKIDIDLKDYKEGKHVIEVTENLLNLPRNIDVIKIQPNKIHVHLSRYVEKRVKVYADYKGDRKILLEPAYVRIRGERKTLANIDGVNTESFTANNPDTFYVKIQLPFENIKVEPEKVKVKVF